jgi:hypothetical protein
MHLDLLELPTQLFVRKTEVVLFCCEIVNAPPLTSKRLSDVDGTGYQRFWELLTEYKLFLRNAHGVIVKAECKPMARKGLVYVCLPETSE